MKDLLVLWDPQNPLVPAKPVVEALKGLPDLRVVIRTFEDTGHRTLPNGAYAIPLGADGREPEGVLWIEGGPLPSNLEEFRCPKACWLVNATQEPGFLESVESRFDRIFSASIEDCADEHAWWLPAAGEFGTRLEVPQGLSVLVGDPKPPEHAQIEHLLESDARGFGRPSVPVVLALGNGGQPHPLLLDCLRSGAAVVTDPGTDLRGVAHVGEHLDVYPSKGELLQFLHGLLGDSEKLARLTARGPAVAGHLHEPALRAARIVEGLWPRVRILSGSDHRPRVAVLVTCYRYLRRFRVCLESLVRQVLPPGALEIVVADPGSPDGLEEELGAFAARHPEVRVIHVPLDPRYHRNRGLGINRAFESSRAPIVIAIDGDMVFPPSLIGLLEDHVRAEPGFVYGVRRIFVGRLDTEKILKGELDPFAEYERLSRSEGDGEEKAFVGVLGYCQAVHRKAFARARYPEEFDVVNQSDIVFVERLARHANVTARYLRDVTALHLWHPRNWQGTDESL